MSTPSQLLTPISRGEDWCSWEIKRQGWGWMWVAELGFKLGLLLITLGSLDKEDKRDKGGEHRWQLRAESKHPSSPPRDETQTNRGRGQGPSSNPLLYGLWNSGPGKDRDLPKVIQSVAEIPVFLNFLYFWRIQYYQASTGFIKDFIFTKMRTVQEKRFLYLDILNK